MSALTLEDIASSNGGGSIETSEEENSDDDALPGIFEEIGADLDRVREFRDHGRTTDDQFEALGEFAEALAEDDDLFELMEKSRELVDLYWIEINYIRGKREGPFIDEFKSALYGDSNDPDPGTKNYVDQQRRDHEHANLAWYKTMFPEPVEEYFAGTPVVWMEADEIGLPIEDGVRDSHVYVTQEWAESYMDHGEEIDGQVRPLPPEEIPDGTATAFDPAEYTIEELNNEVLPDVDDPEVLRAAYESEENGKDRKGARAAIEQRIAGVTEGGGSESSGNEDVANALLEAAQAVKSGEVDPDEATLGDFL